MSFLNSSDMVEEDAADLQFPKVSSDDFDDSVYTIMPDSNTKFCVKNYSASELQSNSALHKNSDANQFYEANCCLTCHRQLQHPYIKCADCKETYLCVQCFARGRETAHHSNSHSYIILHENIEVFADSNWILPDEKKLLECLETWGYGNWEDIANAMGEKFTKEDCAKHYHQYYFDGIFEKKLGLTNDFYFPERIPYFYKMISVDPPRCETTDSFQFNNMDGYRCARSDFDIPYDKSAETLICEIDSQNYASDCNEGTDPQGSEYYETICEMEEELKLAIVQAYNNRLKERYRRYKIMQEHGLLVPNKTQSWLSKYNEAIKMHLNPLSTKYGNKIGRFPILMQLCSGVAFDTLLESLQYYMELKKYLFNLFEFRSNGIKWLYAAKVYNRLKLKRLRTSQELKEIESVYNWRLYAPTQDGGENTQFGFGVQNFFGKSRKKAGPINIMGFPGYEKLTDEEKQLCSNARILPASYLEFKSILQNECTKLGFLRLSDARRLIKIDVNKTRQLFDFLIENGYCTKPNES